LKGLEADFALVRGWCRQDSVEEFDQVLALRGEVDRLRELVGSTVRWFRDTGPRFKPLSSAPLGSVALAARRLVKLEVVAFAVLERSDAPPLVI
jgi:hypothetical protein